MFIGVSALVAGVLGKKWLHRLNNERLLETWMSRRAKAETQRLGYFELATRSPDHAEAASQIPLPLLQLEYFRRYQLDVQIAFCRSGHQRHALALGKMLAMREQTVLIGAISAGLGGILGLFKPDLTGFATGASSAWLCTTCRQGKRA